MSAFDRAAATLAADPNIGATVLYARQGAAWSPLSLRVVLSVPVEEYQLAEGAGVVAPHLEAMMPAAALPDDPAEDDTLTLADGTALAVTVATRDKTGASWTLRLKEQPAALTDGSGSGITIGGASIFP